MQLPSNFDHLILSGKHKVFETAFDAVCQAQGKKYDSHVRLWEFVPRQRFLTEFRFGYADIPLAGFNQDEAGRLSSEFATFVIQAKERNSIQAFAVLFGFIEKAKFPGIVLRVQFAGRNQDEFIPSRIIKLA